MCQRKKWQEMRKTIGENVFDNTTFLSREICVLEVGLKYFWSCNCIWSHSFLWLIHPRTREDVTWLFSVTYSTAYKICGFWTWELHVIVPSFFKLGCYHIDSLHHFKKDRTFENQIFVKMLHICTLMYMWFVGKSNNHYVLHLTSEQESKHEQAFWGSMEAPDSQK